MLRRSWRISLLVVLLFVSGSTVSASNDYVMKRFAGDVYYGGQKLTSESMPVLQHNGAAYIPVRAFEYVEGFVGYDAKTKSIYLDSFYPKQYGATSQIYDKSENELFQLRINSGSTSYKVGDPLNIWTTLNVKSNHTIQLRHSSLIQYRITDADGHEVGNPTAARWYESVLQPDDEILESWSDLLIYQYNVWKHNIIEEQDHKKVPRLLRLPAGTYTISAIVEYQVADENQEYEDSSIMEKLAAKIQITIE